MDRNENYFVNEGADLGLKSEKPTDTKMPSDPEKRDLNNSPQDQTKSAAQLNKNANEQEEKEEPVLEFGWGKFRPKCLQILNGPKSFLSVIIIYTLCQGITIIGLQGLVLPSIERRFSLSSKELGFIAAANDVTALLLVVFISYYGDYGNKIKWIGWGATFVGIGALVFASPHFLVGKYQPINVHTRGRCSITNVTANLTLSNCEGHSGAEWYHMMVFVIAQLTLGGGISPMYSLLPAYMDENVEPKSIPIYLGIWYCFSFTGPGFGYLIGGKLLSIYVDIDQPAGQNLTPKDPAWIGAWWLGFVIFGLIILLCSVVLLGFPREMPGAKQRRLKHIQQGNIKAATDEKKPSLRDFLPELKKLLTNWTYLFNTLGLTIILLYAASVSVFFSKIFRLKFGLDPVTTGYVIAMVSITGVALGNACGSISVRMFSLKETCKKAALMCMVGNFLAVGGSLPFLLPGCENTNMAGISDTKYNPGVAKNHIPTTSSFPSALLKARCNANCGCSLKTFSPVCGSDSITYFDACHAGCIDRLPNGIFANCSCIPGNSTDAQQGTARPGYCDRNCKNLVGFAFLMTMVAIVSFSTQVPGRIVCLRCVPDNKRAFAVGMQYVSLKTLGLLPGPIIFGHLVDLSCRLWQAICGKRGRCFDYDIESLSRIIAIYGLGIRAVSSCCYFLAWYFCKPSELGARTELETDGTGVENRAADHTADGSEVTQL